MASSRVLLLCLVVLCAAAPSTHKLFAQPAQVINREYEIKAGYFAYFGKLVTWPQQLFPGADREFVISVLGNNPFGQHLVRRGNGFALSAGRVNVDRIQGKAIRVLEYQSTGDLARNYRPCHILFVCRSGAAGESVQQRVNDAVQKTAGQPTLIVAEATSYESAAQLARSGAVICYWNDNRDNQLKMLVNREAERRAGLTISSNLLRLRIVQVL